MRVDTKKLKCAINSAGYTQERLSEALSIDKSTFSRKMQSAGLSFSIGEMHRMVDILGLTNSEASEIFLA